MTPASVPAANPSRSQATKVGLVWMTAASTPLDHPVALALDRSGRVYVVDAGHSRIAVFDRDGQFLRAWGSAGAAAGQFRFLGPEHCPDSYHADECAPEPGGAVAIDDQERVYVADFGNHRVQVFDPAGHLLTAWGREGREPGEFRAPGGIAVDAQGRVYVSERENHRVQVFDRGGGFLRAWDTMGTSAGQFVRRPGPLALDGHGRLAVADQADGRVQFFDQDGRFLTAWRVWADGAPSTHPAVAGLAFDAHGNLLVAGPGADLHHLSALGQVLRRWRADWSGEGRLWRPAGVAVDDAGDVYVADLGGDQLVKFSILSPVTR
jgi:DNA-binding beta-propeller fold protein YncE